MALALLTTTAFERDLKRVGKQGKDLDKLENVVNLLQQQPLPTRWRPHPLRGNWIGALGLPYRARLAPALQADEYRTDAGPYGEPLRPVRMKTVPRHEGQVRPGIQTKRPALSRIRLSMRLRQWSKTCD